MVGLPFGLHSHAQSPYKAVAGPHTRQTLIYRLLSSIKTSADPLFALQVIVQFHNPW